MRVRRRWLGLLTLCIIPVVCWIVYKPTRVLLPELNGVSCISKTICVEQLDTAVEARALYEKAESYFRTSIYEIRHRPRAIFCSSVQCFEAFGFRAPAKAQTVGQSGIVIGPQGWHVYLLRHEMVHHLQAERLGIVKQLLIADWFKEGMAYSVSADPRELKQPWKSYRKEFERWYENVGEQNFWQEAEKL